jgi:hypothetical protein
LLGQPAASDGIGLTQARVECCRVRLYQSFRAMTSAIARRRVLKRGPCSRSSFEDQNSVSLLSFHQTLD